MKWGGSEVREGGSELHLLHLTTDTRTLLWLAPLQWLLPQLCLVRFTSMVLFSDEAFPDNILTRYQRNANHQALNGT